MNEMTKWDEIKLIQDSYFKLWAMFFTWSNWFLGLNILVIGWIVTTNNTAIQKDLVAPLSIVMGFCAASGVWATNLIRSFSQDCQTRTRELAVSIAADGEHTIAADTLLGTKLFRSVCAINFGAMAGAILCWIYLGVRHG